VVQKGVVDQEFIREASKNHAYSSYEEVCAAKTGTINNSIIEKDKTNESKN
jgi:hypothetical protein